ncbi:MAG: hypothetical protein U0736_07055 [Gemmataceae bacterium]
MRIVLSAVVLLALAVPAVRADDTPAAAKTRKLLQTKISVDFSGTRMAEVKEELMNEVKGLKVMLDNKGGVSNNRTVTYKAEGKTVEVVLDEMLKKLGGLGYIVISRKGNAYDGVVMIKVGDERGHEKKK